MRKAETKAIDINDLQIYVHQLTKSTHGHLNFLSPDSAYYIETKRMYTFMHSVFSDFCLDINVCVPHDHLRNSSRR